ncbi:hypothetical protein WJX72_000245 [[Myrmecia] bisecta]|uniref:Uncharacterized protein n=1 Tax=[Myrmecia] bisecta TaxID=41462 RepID=A0AAW1QDW8_9CHLO
MTIQRSGSESSLRRLDPQLEVPRGTGQALAPGPGGCLEVAHISSSAPQQRTLANDQDVLNASSLELLEDQKHLLDDAGLRFIQQQRAFLQGKAKESLAALPADVSVAEASGSETDVQRLQQQLAVAVAGKAVAEKQREEVLSLMQAKNQRLLAVLQDQARMREQLQQADASARSARELTTSCLDKLTATGPTGGGDK